MKGYVINIDECMVYNWRKCQEGDLKYTRKDISKGDKDSDALAYDMIYDSYLKKFGLGKNFERVLELKKEIALLQCDLVIDSNNSLKNIIRRYKKELEDILNKPSDGDLTTVLIHVSKWMGSPVREKETTVLELYSMLEVMKKEAEQIKQQQKAK